MVEEKGFLQQGKKGVPLGGNIFRSFLGKLIEEGCRGEDKGDELCAREEKKKPRGGGGKCVLDDLLQNQKRRGESRIVLGRQRWGKPFSGGGGELKML